MSLLLILFALFNQTVELVTASYFGNGILLVHMIVSYLSSYAQLLFDEMEKI
jgi:hypothetical protein